MASRTGFRVGDAVRVRPDIAPNAGRRYGARIGKVVVANHVGEVGVSFNGNASTQSWFLPGELEHAPDAP